MKKIVLNDRKIKEFEIYLREEERSRATIEKYMRDVRFFYTFAGQKEIDRQTVIDYKNSLAENYAMTSANSMIAALNCFFRFCGLQELCVKQYRIQS